MRAAGSVGDRSRGHRRNLNREQGRNIPANACSTPEHRISHNANIVRNGETGLAQRTTWKRTTLTRLPHAFKTPFVTSSLVLLARTGIAPTRHLLLFDQMLLRLPPVAQPERWRIRGAGKQNGSNSCTRRAAATRCSAIRCRDLEKAQSGFSSLAHRTDRRQRRDEGEVPLNCEETLGSGPFPRFDWLALGRLFPNDDQTLGGHPIVLNYAFWERGRLRPERLNQITVNGQQGRSSAWSEEFQWHHARRASVRLRADHDARAAQPRLPRVRSPKRLLGLFVRSPQTRRLAAAGAHGDQHHLHADHQRRRSAAAKGPQRSDAREVQVEETLAC